jgi:hypothetical protein
MFLPYNSAIQIRAFQRKVSSIEENTESRRASTPAAQFPILISVSREVIDPPSLSSNHHAHNCSFKCSYDCTINYAVYIHPFHTQSHIHLRREKRAGNKKRTWKRQENAPLVLYMHTWGQSAAFLPHRFYQDI